MAAARGTEEFVRAAQVLNEAGDKAIRTQVYAAFRDAAKPLSQDMLSNAGQVLPQRGGLARRVADSKVAQANSTTGRNPGVALRLRSKQGYDLRTIDAGTVRHPVFARPGKSAKWIRQRIPAGAFSVPFEAGADRVRRKVIDALHLVLEDIARSTSKGTRNL